MPRTRRRGETLAEGRARRRAKFKLLFWQGFGRYGMCSSCGQPALVAGRRRNALKCEGCIDALADPPALAMTRGTAA
jgi:hypothetical protein